MRLTVEIVVAACCVGLIVWQKLKLAELKRVNYILADESSERFKQLVLQVAEQRKQLAAKTQELAELTLKEMKK